MKMPKKGLLILCVTFFAFLGLMYLIRPFGTGETVVSDGYSDVLVDHRALVQPLSAPNPVSSVSFQIGTLLQKYEKGTLEVSILDAATKETIETHVFESPRLVDNCTLSIETKLDKGEYLLSFKPENLGIGKGMVLYTTTGTANKCSIEGEEKDYSVFLTVKRFYEKGYLKRLGLGIILAVGAAVAGCLILSNIRLSRKGLIADRKRNRLRIGAALLCLAGALALVASEYMKMINSGSANYMKNSRLFFYSIVVLIAGFEWLVAEDHFQAGWLLIILLGAVWILTDLKYNYIDEKAHTDIIQYILKNNGQFPTVQQNYEAVQGPVYYYVMALLLGWMPMESLYIGGRFLGLIMLILLGRLTKKNISLLREAGIVKVSDRTVHVFMLIFIFNAQILIRMTRVSNDSLMCLLTGIIVFQFTKMMINGYDLKKLFGITILCAITFLTKATSAVIFGLVFLTCAYHKKWIDFLKQVLVYMLIVAPWFISNYMTYGALTGMKEHMEFVLPILNPHMNRPDVWHHILNYFYAYYGVSKWYDFYIFDSFTKSVSIVLLFVSFALSIGILYRSVRSKLNFNYARDEKKEILYLSYTALPAALIVMHSVQSLMTYIPTIRTNRHCLLLNIVFCAMFMFGMRTLSERTKRYIEVIVLVVFGFFTAAMICDYTQLAVSYVI